MYATIKLTPATFYGLRVLHGKPGENTFVALPPELWRSAGRCDCDYCKGGEGFWDTLAIPPDDKLDRKGIDRNSGTYTVHYPALQPR
jgi:hypothetical protein